MEGCKMKKSLSVILVITFIPVICLGKMVPITIKVEYISQPELSQHAFYGNFDQVKQLITTGTDVMQEVGLV